MIFVLCLSLLISTVFAKPVSAYKEDYDYKIENVALYHKYPNISVRQSYIHLIAY